MITYSNDNEDAILSRGNALLKYMLDCHNKVGLIRWDLHFPENGYSVDGENKEISRVMKQQSEAFEELGCEAVSAWVRERKKGTPHHHYHGYTIVDGSKIQNPDGTRGSIEGKWNKIVGVKETGLLDYCQQKKDGLKDSGMIMIRRPSSNASGDALEEQKRAFEEKRAEAIYAMSYLAKSHSKEDDLPKGMRMFGSSQIVSAQKKKRPARAGRSKPNHVSTDTQE